MSEREDNVYKAKLAEQAERYDGKTLISGTDSRFVNENLLNHGKCHLMYDWSCSLKISSERGSHFNRDQA